MRRVDVVREGSEPSLIARAEVASSVWSRFWGLMGRRSLPEGEALVIDPCSSVHTMFMWFPIDVVFLDEDNRVTKMAENLKPMRAAIGRGSRRVLEMPAGAAGRTGLRVGDRLTIREAG